VTTEDALAAVDEMAREEGLFACPESATTLAGLRTAIARGWIKRTDDVVLISTGSGLKSIPTLAPPDFPKITSAAELRLS